MSLVADTVGLRARPWSGLLDARWLMAYAAGLGHDEDVYFDTTRANGVLAHPVFPIAPEWALLTNADSGLDAGLTIEESLRGVHAAHDLHLHRPIFQGIPISVHAEVVGAQRTQAGALMTVRFDGVAEDGGRVWTSWMGAVYRGVSVNGEDRPPEDAVPTPQGASEDTIDRTRCIEIAAAAPHVYSECGRLWNPIHTDRSIALAAGLDGIVLHGSATLAHGVDWALKTMGAAPEGVRRVGASFRAMVPVPSTIATTVTATGRLPNGDRLVRFEVRNSAGEGAVRDGFLVAVP